MTPEDRAADDLLQLTAELRRQFDECTAQNLALTGERAQLIAAAPEQQPATVEVLQVIISPMEW